MTVINRSSLLAIKGILEEFATFSGLHCNFDKTALLSINPVSNEERGWIAEAGFTLVNKIKLLGADITSNPEEWSNNFNTVYEKIVTQINYWSRFRLSLPGRIAIAKTYMLSQINYLGSVFSPTDDQMRVMQESINNFIRKNLKISEERMYLPADKGGVGFFNIKEFLDAQKCTWIFRAYKKRIDNWRYDLQCLAPLNNPLLIRKEDVPVNTHPLLHNICVSYEKFYSSFSAADSNFKECYIYENDIFRDPATGAKLGKNFFGNDFYQNNKNIIRTLTYNDCFTDAGFKTVREFSDGGLHLSLVLWMRLQNTLMHFKAGFNPETAKSTGIINFVNRWRKGGKIIRSHIQRRNMRGINIRNSRSFLTFADLVGTVPNINLPLGTWTSVWNIASLTNDFRVFIYNSRFNCLPTNNRLHAYKPDVDPACTYCRHLDRPAPRDSPTHCFMYCKCIMNLLMETNFLAGIECVIESQEFATLFWYGYKNVEKFLAQNHLSYLLLYDSYRYIIFKNRLRKILPSNEAYRKELINHISWLCRCNKNIKLAFNLTFQGTRLIQAMG
jgi:hypothetical protein